MKGQEGGRTVVVGGFGGSDGLRVGFWRGGWGRERVQEGGIGIVARGQENINIQLAIIIFPETEQ
jgi:hypothetical protein